MSLSQLDVVGFSAVFQQKGRKGRGKNQLGTAKGFGGWLVD
jgi:hypothetical protein